MIDTNQSYSQHSFERNDLQWVCGDIRQEDQRLKKLLLHC